MNNELLKKHIQENAEAAVIEFQKRDDIVCRFDAPVIAYVDAEDVRFDMLFARGLNDHPKKIYRPGKTIIVHYTPFAEEIVKENEEADAPTETWVRGYMESLWLAMILNRTIINTVHSQGRLTSYLNTMMEWNSRTCREPWSHKLTAAIGGLGEIGPAGSFNVNGRYGGRVSGIITDGLYAEKAPAFNEQELEEQLIKLTAGCMYDGPCSREMISACPGGAISGEGIDALKCQKYCESLNNIIPMPEVCGKCFRFRP